MGAPISINGQIPCKQDECNEMTQFCSLFLTKDRGRLRGLAVACWTTDHYHACSNPGVGISEGCFIFEFSSLPLDVAWPV